MSSVDWINELNRWIEAKEKLWDEYFSEYFNDLLDWYKDINKKTVEWIITRQILPEARDRMYEYLYSYWALLNMYTQLKDDLYLLSQEWEAKEVILWLRDKKIDWITTTYGKNLQIIIKELRKHKDKISKLEKANRDRINNWEVKINFFDISSIDQSSLVDKYLEWCKVVEEDIDKFVSDEFFWWLIDKLSNISDLKKNNTGSINDSNTINEIWEDFFELITIYWELRKFFAENKDLRELYDKAEISLSKVTKQRDELLEKLENLKKINNVTKKLNSSKSEKYSKLLEEHSELWTNFDTLERKYSDLEFENKKIDSDNEYLDRENRELKAHVAELCTILWMKPSKIEWIIDFIKKERQFEKTVQAWSKVIWKAVWIISEDKSYLAQQVEIEKNKNRTHVSEKNTLQRKLDKSEQEKKAMQKQIDEMQKLINDNNIKKTKDWYNPTSISA